MHKIVNGWSRRSLIALVMLAVVAGGCSRGCGGKKEALDFMPEDSALTVVVPDLNQAFTGFFSFLGKFSDLPMVKMGFEQQKAAFVKELGIDPEKPETLKAKGLSPITPVAVSLGSDGRSIALSFQVEDKANAEKFMRELLNKIMPGGVNFEEKKEQGLTLTMLKRAGSNEAYATWTFVRQVCLVILHAPEGKFTEYAAAIIKAKKSIKNNQRFTKLRDQIGPHQLLLFFDGAAMQKLAQSISPAKGEDSLGAYIDAGAVALQISAQGISLRGKMLNKAGKGKDIAQLYRGRGKAAPKFGEFIGAQALGLAKASFNFKLAMEKMKKGLPAMQQMAFEEWQRNIEEKIKLKLDSELLEQLTGRLAVALYPPSADMLKGLKPVTAFDEMIRLFLRPVFMLQITDEAKAAQLLVKAREILKEQPNLTVASPADNEKEKTCILSKEKEQPLVCFQLVKDLLLVSLGGEEALKLSSTMINRGGAHIIPTLTNAQVRKYLTDDAGQLAYFKVGKTAEFLLKTAQEMDAPPDAKAIFSSIIAMFTKFNDLSLGGEITDEEISGELTLELSAK